jgi:DNA (cytosine-5)-methyltransferase 1
MYYIDLFSGIGGFHLGLLQAGFKFEKYYHSEINKYAKSVYQKQFPDSEDLGDVTRINVSGLPKGKYIISAGWPCQDNSIAGKRKGQSGGLRSGLFSEVVRILSELIQMGSEVIFIGENVKGLYSVNEGMDFHDTITRLTYFDTDMSQLTLEMQLCNTRWFLPQNRERIYFVGYTGNGSGRKVFPIGESNQRNSKTQRTTQNKRSRVWRNYPCIRSEGGNKKGLIADSLQERDYKGGQLVQIKAVLTPDRKQKRQHGRRKKNYNEPIFTLTKQDIHGIEISPCIRFEHHNTKDVHFIKDKERSIRRLTPVECARLQGFPDLWCIDLSDTQAYKCYGNSVSVPVVKIIASRIKEIFI